MTAYYNEIDPFAAAWLRELIREGLIADGEVDERDIRDVRADDVRGFTQCHFFAGIGGWSLALRLANWPDDRSVWTGSCPCQPFSESGRFGGFADERHLWPVWRALIEARMPPVVFGEQVAAAFDWLALVRSDMDALGFTFGALPIEAACIGSDQLRDRFWFVADANSIGWEMRWVKEAMSGQTRREPSRDQGEGHFRGDGIGWLTDRAGKKRRFPDEISPLADGVSGSMAHLHAIGNAIVPQVAAAFIGAYMEIA